MAEVLSEYFTEIGVRCRYLHSEVETLDRIKILRDLRRGEFDVLIGINLLREGLDLPEVSLVAILDADKEGFLRSTTSLIQTIGRCARHIEGRAILYADRRTDSMNQAIDETNRRRAKQVAYNKENNITPMSIIKSVDMELARIVEADYVTVPVDDASLDAATANIKSEAQLAGRVRERIKRRDAHADVDAGVEAESDNQRDCGENANPPVAEQNTEDWRDVHEQKAGDGNRHECHAVAHAGEEIFRDATNQIAEAGVPPDNDEILRNTRARTKTRLLYDFSQLHVIHNFHGQAAVHAAGFIGGATEKLERANPEIGARMGISHAIGIGSNVKRHAKK